MLKHTYTCIPSVADPGYSSQIPDPDFFHPGSGSSVVPYVCSTRHLYSRYPTDSLLLPCYILKSVFRIHEILGWIRIRGSMPLTSGSGSGSWIRILLFSSLTFKMPTKNKFLTQCFLLITFWRYIYIIFQRQKVKKSHKIVGIKVFLTIFAWLKKDPDPDPGGQKTCGSGFGSGSGALLKICWLSPVQQFSKPKFNSPDAQLSFR